MKTLWVISAGAEAIPGIMRARELGLHVVASDGDPNAPGFAVSDDRIVVSTYDVDATVEAAVRYNREVRGVDGVICIASDVPLTVASVAQALGLPSVSIEAARLSMDKLAMKEHFVRRGVPVPWFSPVESPAHLGELVGSKDYPLVLKPVDSRGARGVLRLTPEVDIDWAYQYSLKYSPTRRLMVEQYLEGPQISTESVLVEGRAYTPGFGDRNYEYLDRFSPFMIEDGGSQPTTLKDKEKRSVTKSAEEAARALGIETGVAKGDMVLTADGPKVIEVAPRLSGGWFSTDQIPLATGVDIVGAAIKLALGESVNEELLVGGYRSGVAIRYFFPSPGRVVEIKNSELFSKTPWVHRIGFFVSPGDMVEPASDHTRRAGFVITAAPTSKEAVALAEEVIRTIEIKTIEPRVA